MAADKTLPPEKPAPPPPAATGEAAPPGETLPRQQQHVVHSQAFGRYPQRETCPSCGLTSTTRTEMNNCTLGNWLIVILCFFPAALCLFTNCSCNCLARVDHKCHSCGHPLGTGKGSC